MKGYQVTFLNCKNDMDKNMQALSSLPWKYVPVKFTIITLHLDLPNSQNKIV